MTNQPASVATGIYDITNTEYHTGPGISNSDLKNIRKKAPIHFWAKKYSEIGVADQKTKAKQLGTDVHCALLEPDLFRKNYVIIPEDAPRKPTSVQWNAKNPSPDSIYAMEWWSEFNAKNELKTLISVGDYAACQRIRDIVLSDPDIGPLFSEGVAERSFFATDEDTGLLLKCRPDWMTPTSIILDLKKVTDCSKYGFGKAAANYGYYEGAAYYLDVIGMVTGKIPEWFVLVAVEELYPHDIGFYYVTKSQLEKGRRKYRDDLRRIAECERSNFWPKTCSKGVEPLWVPRWALEDN